MDAADVEEFRALRREIELRITLQNLFLVLVPLLLAAMSVAQLVHPADRFGIALAFCIATGIFSLHWIHSGARTVQLKAYLTEVVEPRMRPGGGWEAWHARRRIAGVLGSRWFISTKGVLVGSQVAILAEAWLIAPPAGADWPVTFLGLLAPAASAVLLVKPRMAPPPS